MIIYPCAKVHCDTSANNEDTPGGLYMSKKPNANRVNFGSFPDSSEVALDSLRLTLDDTICLADSF